MEKIKNPNSKTSSRCWKILNMIYYFVDKNGETIDKSKMMNLFWMSDRYNFINFGSFISNDLYYAMQNGPVPSLAYDLTKVEFKPSLHKSLRIGEDFLKETKNSISLPNKVTIWSNKKPDLEYFSEGELEVMDTIYDKVKDVSSEELSKYSHGALEWNKHEDYLKSNPNESKDMSQADFLSIIENDEFQLFDKNSIGYLIENCL